MKQVVLSLQWIAPIALVVLGFHAVHAQANDMFPTKAAAEQRQSQSHNPVGVSSAQSRGRMKSV